MKKLIKVLLVALGVFTLGLLILAYYGIIAVNWDKLALLVERTISGAQVTVYSLQSFIIASIPFAGAFTAGFILGFKYG